MSASFTTMPGALDVSGQQDTAQFCDQLQLAALLERLAHPAQQQDAHCSQEQQTQQQWQEQHIQQEQQPSEDGGGPGTDWVGDAAVPMSTSPGAAPRCAAAVRNCAGLLCRGAPGLLPGSTC